MGTYGVKRVAKYPILITYIRTSDRGKELRHSLRSLENITNWNGEVYVVGDREPWFSDINHIPYKRLFGKPYLDQVNKLRHAIHQLDSDKVIISMDDIYVTEPTEIGFYYRGELTGGTDNYYRRTKFHTADLLREQSIEPLDFECHAPYLVDKDKFIQITDLIIHHPQGSMLQWRSLYGNIHQPESEYFEDKKTKTSKLREGAIISTQIYTPELEKLLPKPSRFEKM